MQDTLVKTERELKSQPLIYILAIAALAHKALQSFLLLCLNLLNGALTVFLRNFFSQQISLVPYVIFLIYVLACYKKSRGGFLMPLVFILLMSPNVPSYISAFTDWMMYAYGIDTLFTSLLSLIIGDMFVLTMFLLMFINSLRNFSSKALTIVSTAVYVGSLSFASLISLISYITNYVDYGSFNFYSFFSICMGTIAQALLVAAIFVFAIRNGGNTARIEAAGAAEKVEAAEDAAAESAEDEFPEFI